MFDSLNLIADASINIFSFIIALSIIVFIHEYGHYIVGRWCGIKAEIFSIGFGPVIFSRIDKSGTKWQIAALPLGGYVKFIKDDESLNFDNDLNAAIIIPDKDIIPGAETLSPAYIIFDNYEKILNWNRSLRFALAVCTLKENFKNEI